MPIRRPFSFALKGSLVVLLLLAVVLKNFPLLIVSIVAGGIFTLWPKHPPCPHKIQTLRPRPLRRRRRQTRQSLPSTATSPVRIMPATDTPPTPVVSASQTTRNPLIPNRRLTLRERVRRSMSQIVGYSQPEHVVNADRQKKEQPSAGLARMTTRTVVIE